jgi:D-3-phosphoglycerate dehydrogenase / 2-oxoglutarate reductase
MKFIILDTFHESLASMLVEAGHECVDFSEKSEGQIFEAMKDAEGVLLRGRIPIRAELINRSAKLKLIGRVGAGLEYIDVEYARSKGILVLSSPEGNRQAVAEHALAMLLSLFNHIPKANEEVRRGIWDRKANEGIELQGKTVGIIGHGNTGAAFARVVSGFGVKVLAYDKYKAGFENESTMHQVFEEADVVSIHLPLASETLQLVSNDWLKQFAKPIYLINTSRGKILNTENLLDSIDDGMVLGACLDVLEFETENLKMPPLDELPDTARRLMSSSRVLLSPHVAGITVQSYEKLSRVLAEKILSSI